MTVRERDLLAQCHSSAGKSNLDLLFSRGGAKHGFAKDNGVYTIDEWRKSVIELSNI